MRKRVFITGTNRGTGFAIASHFSSAGYEIISLNRTLLGLAWLGELRCDISDLSALNTVLDIALGGDIPIDVCVLNAVARNIKPITEMSESEWIDSVNTNLNSAFCILRRMIPILERSKGTLAFIGSEASSHFFEGGSAYCSTKAALRALAEVFYFETAQKGIRTVQITPGAIRNRPGDESECKMSPKSVAELVFNAVNAAADTVVSEIVCRPSKMKRSPVEGINRLSYLGHW